MLCEHGVWLAVAFLGSVWPLLSSGAAIVGGGVFEICNVLLRLGSSKKPPRPESDFSLGGARTMTGSHCKAAFLALFVAIAAPQHGAAQERVEISRDWEICHGASGYSRAACDRLLSRRDLSRGQRAQVHYWRGNGFARKRDWARAIEEFTKAIRLRPRFHKAYRNRGVAKLDFHEFASALGDFEHCVEIYPHSAVCHQNIAYGLAVKKIRLRKALWHARRLIAHKPTASRSYMTRGAVYEAMGRIDLAIRDLQKAVQLDPRNTMAAKELNRIRIGR